MFLRRAAARSREDFEGRRRDFIEIAPNHRINRDFAPFIVLFQNLRPEHIENREVLEALENLRRAVVKV